jgi:hypothetical protein
MAVESANYTTAPIEVAAQGGKTYGWCTSPRESGALSWFESLTHSTYLRVNLNLYWGQGVAAQSFVNICPMSAISQSGVHGEFRV